MDVVWSPSDEAIANANVTSAARALGVDGLAGLRALARTDIAGFYDRLVKHIGLAWFDPYAKTLDLSRGAPFAKWFAGGRYNASYNCVDRHVLEGRGADEAIASEGEDGDRRSLTFEGMLAEMCRLSAALRSRDIAKGERVGIYIYYGVLPGEAIYEQLFLYVSRAWPHLIEVARLVRESENNPYAFDKAEMFYGNMNALAGRQMQKLSRALPKEDRAATVSDITGPYSENSR